MNEEIVIELGDVSEETKGLPEGQSETPVPDKLGE
jgi:hypothetical protein